MDNAATHATFLAAADRRGPLRVDGVDRLAVSSNGGTNTRSRRSWRRPSRTGPQRDPRLSPTTAVRQPLRRHGTMWLPRPWTALAQTKTTSPSLALVVLAAGKGKRLRSRAPRSCIRLRRSRPLWHVLQLRARREARRSIVTSVGHGADEVRAAVRSWGLTPAPVFVEQSEQLGHRSRGARGAPGVGRVDDVLVRRRLRPDPPRDVRRSSSGTAVRRRGDDRLGRAGRPRRVRPGGPRRRAGVEIVEYVDASPTSGAIREVATNWVAFRRDALFGALPKLDRKTASTSTT